MELLDDQLRVEQEVHLVGAELARQAECADDGRVLGHVVRGDPEVVGDRREWSRQRIARVRC